MMRRIREKSHSESGFTLIELLVVVLILGILAAIAVPSFINQRSKAQDAEAKSYVRTSQTAAETFATDNDGTYTGMADTDLETIEPTLTNANALTVVSGAATYTLTVTSDSATTFSIARAAGGAITRTCSDGGSGGCQDDGAGGGTW